jgi:hypothetical protein
MRVCFGRRFGVQGVPQLTALVAASRIHPGWKDRFHWRIERKRDKSSLLFVASSTTLMHFLRLSQWAAKRVFLQEDHRA